MSIKLVLSTYFGRVVQAFLVEEKSLFEIYQDHESVLGKYVVVSVIVSLTRVKSEMKVVGYKHMIMLEVVL